MAPELIHKFLETEKINGQLVKIEFKKRNAVNGLFVRVADYNDLRSKNFWRIVPETNIEQWNKTKDINLVRMFNGMEFTRLSIVKAKMIL